MALTIPTLCASLLFRLPLRMDFPLAGTLQRGLIGQDVPMMGGSPSGWGPPSLEVLLGKGSSMLGIF